MTAHLHTEYPETERPGVPFVGYTDPHEQTASDDETEPVQTFHEGDLVQVRGGTRGGEFAKVTKAFGFMGALNIRFVFGDERRELHYFADELKLIRAADKPGWERYGMVRHVHKWRLWRGANGWTAVQPFQCDTPLFSTGFGHGSRSYQKTLDELRAAILKGEAAMHLKEALS